MGYYPDNKEEREAFIAWTNKENVYFLGINPDSLNDMKRIYIKDKNGNLNCPFEKSDEKSFKEDRKHFFNQRFFEQNEVYVLPFGDEKPKHVKIRRIGRRLVFTAEDARSKVKKQFADMKLNKGEQEIIREEKLHYAERVLMRAAHDREVYHELFADDTKQGDLSTYAEFVRGSEKSGLSLEKVRSKDMLSAFTIMALYDPKCNSGNILEQLKAVNATPAMLSDLTNQDATPDGLDVYYRRIHESRERMKDAFENETAIEVLKNGICGYAFGIRNFQMSDKTGMISVLKTADILPGQMILKLLDYKEKLKDQIEQNEQCRNALTMIRAQSAAYELGKNQAENYKTLFAAKAPKMDDAKKQMKAAIADEIMLYAFSAAAENFRTAGPKPTDIEKIFADKDLLAKAKQAILNSKKITDIINGKQNMETIRSYMTSPEYKKMVKAGAETFQNSLKDIMNGKEFPDFNEKAEFKKKEEQKKKPAEDGNCTDSNQLQDNEKDNYFEEPQLKKVKSTSKTELRKHSLGEMYDDILPMNSKDENKAEEQKIAAEKNVQDQLQVSRKAENYLILAEKSIKKNTKLKTEFNSFKALMHTFESLIDQYTKNEKGNEYIISDIELWDIKNHFEFIHSKAIDLLDLSRKAGLGEKTGFYRSIETIDRILTKDMKTFKHLHADNTSSLKQLLANAQSEIIDISQIHIKTESDKMSVRMPMEVPRKVNGKIIYQKGMFTAEKNVDIEQNLYQMLKDYADKDPYKQAIEELDRIQKKSKVNLVTFFGDLYRGEDYPIALPDKYKNTELDDWYTRCIMSLEGSRLINNAVKQIVQDRQMVKNGVPYAGNIEQRNCAASAVAELLDMSDLIAESVPMTIWDGTKYIRGSFMKYAEGVDLGKIKEDDPVVKMDNRQVSVNGLIAGSNLQVLDFICGQYDRHENNVFWQFHNNKIVGMQGIDNDSSFVDLPESILYGEKEFQHFKGLNKLKFIEEKTARIINSMKPETLRSVLSHYRLSEKEINAACKRLGLLKKTMNIKHLHESMEGVDGLDMDDHHIYVLNRDQIAKINPHTLITNNINKPVPSIYSEMKYVAEHQFAVKEDDEAEIPQASCMNGSSHISLTRYIEKMNQFTAELKEENMGVFNGSQEYRNVRAYAELMKKGLKIMLEQQKLDRDKINEAFMTLNDLATAYLDKKEDDPSLRTRERSRRRMLAVQHLKDFADNNMKRLGLSDNNNFSSLDKAVRKQNYHSRLHSDQIKRNIAELARNMSDPNQPIAAEYFSLGHIFQTIAGVNNNVNMNLQFIHM